MRASIAAVAALAGFLAITGSAAAAVRYAEPGGDGPAATCPKQDPCEVHDAAESPGADDGDEVVLLPGTYAIGSDNIELSDAIDLHGAIGEPRPVIVSTAAGGTTIDGSPAERIHDLIIHSLNDAPSFGALGTWDGSPVVERVTAVSENASGCVEPPEIPGILRDTVCASGDETGSAVTVDLNASGTHSYRFRNVTAVNHAASGNAIRIATTDAAITVNARNVIAFGPSDIAAIESGSGSINVDLDYSNYNATFTGAGNETITPPGTPNNQIDSPLLADPEDGDFHQLAGSPTIDAGGGPGEVNLLGSLDFERQPRIQGAGIDIGADEFDDRLRLKVKAKKRQKAKKLKVKVKCPEEECTVFAKGRVKAGGETFKLKKTKDRFLAAGERKKLRLRAKKLGRLKNLLEQSDGKAKIKVKGTDAGGVMTKKKKRVKLVG